MHKPTPLPHVTDELRSAFLDGCWNGVAIGVALGAAAVVLILQFLGKL
jgi:hypothetical protein